jgi:hypothetical protein
MNSAYLEEQDKCPYCLAGWPVFFCLWELENGCFGKEDVPAGELSMETTGDVYETLYSEPEEEKVYKDALSTGRKRAALLYPIQTGQVCAWAWHKNCGGGINPISGCTGRPATNLHHGPDKSVFNNEPDNVSAICEYCHNRWHVANDHYYIEPRPANGATWGPEIGIEQGKEVFKLDDKVRATKQEILMAEMLIPEGGKDRA